MSQAILEVIDGPMDGLNSMVTKSGLVGRSVGTVLPLALDMEVSGRHCEVVLEGPTWCLRDQESTNGTWFRSERLAPGRSYPIPDDQIFLVGSTVVQLYKGAVNNPFIAITDPGMKDPRDDYSMNPELEKVWEKLFSVSADGDYCDTSRLFTALLEEVFGKESDKYDCLNQLNSSGKYKILDSWLLNASFEPVHQMVPKALLVAPRVWRLLDIASEKNQGDLGIDDLLKAILEEGRSLAGRHMARDLIFLEAVGLIPAGSAGGGQSHDAQSPGTSVTMPGPEVQGDNAGQYYGTPGLDPVASSAWADFGTKIERLIKGFLEDAANPIAGQPGVQIPGLQRGVTEIMAIADPAARDQAVQEHLDLIYNLLVALLASQKEGCTVYGKKLTQRIDKSIARTQGSKGTVLSLGNKKIDPADVANSIRGSLAKADSSGLADMIVRAVLMDKIKKFGIGS